jgi:hypothetical protein
LIAAMRSYEAITYAERHGGEMELAYEEWPHDRLVGEAQIRSLTGQRQVRRKTQDVAIAVVAVNTISCGNRRTWRCPAKYIEKTGASPNLHRSIGPD